MSQKFAYHVSLGFWFRAFICGIACALLTGDQMRGNGQENPVNLPKADKVAQFSDEEIDWMDRYPSEESASPFLENQPLVPHSIMGKELDCPALRTLSSWPDAETFKKQGVPPSVANNKALEESFWYWTRMFLDNSFVPPQKKGLVRFFPNRGRGDDWMFCSYRLDGLKIQIIDERSLTLFIAPDIPAPQRFPHSLSSRVATTEEAAAKQIGNQNSEKTKIEQRAVWREKILDYVMGVMKQTTTAWRKAETSGAISLYGTESVGDKAFCGQWRVTGERRWFLHDGYWFSDGNVVVLRVEKLLTPPFSITPIESFQKYAGGLPDDNPQPLSRFENPHLDFSKGVEPYASEIRKYREDELSQMYKDGGYKPGDTVNFGAKPVPQRLDMSDPAVQEWLRKEQEKEKKAKVFD